MVSIVGSAVVAKRDPSSVLTRNTLPSIHKYPAPGEYLPRAYGVPSQPPQRQRAGRLRRAAYRLGGDGDRDVGRNGLRGSEQGLGAASGIGGQRPGRRRLAASVEVPNLVLLARPERRQMIRDEQRLP